MSMGSRKLNDLGAAQSDYGFKKLIIALVLFFSHYGKSIDDG